MTSQAQIKEQEWQNYCDKLGKAGLRPSESVARGYQQARQFWNTVDTEAMDDYQRAMENQATKED